MMSIIARSAAAATRTLKYVQLPQWDASCVYGVRTATGETSFGTLTGSEDEATETGADKKVADDKKTSGDEKKHTAVRREAIEAVVRISGYRAAYSYLFLPPDIRHLDLPDDHHYMPGQGRIRVRIGHPELQNLLEQVPLVAFTSTRQGVWDGSAIPHIAASSSCSDAKRAARCDAIEDDLFGGGQKQSLTCLCGAKQRTWRGRLPSVPLPMRELRASTVPAQDGDTSL